ncbi:HNH endonuclease [Litorilituus sediminis]|nr:HNH endonuclease signature motif containing protein [Litorilituus sediminis]
MELVESFEELESNVKAFMQIRASDDSDVLKNFSSFSYWYYFPSLDVFAPNKFIGYKGASIENYTGGVKGDGNGTEARKHMAKWFDEVAPDSEQYATLKDKLELQARSLGKSISSKTFQSNGGIFVPTRERALLLNGVFKNVIEEILQSQAKYPNKTFYLQPHTSTNIRYLQEGDFSELNPTRMLLTTTDNLNSVSYECKVVGWRDKQELMAEELNQLNQNIALLQPSEKEIYGTQSAPFCKNLIYIKDMQEIPCPFDVSELIKESNNQACKHRERAGGHTVVFYNNALIREPSDVETDDISDIFASELSKTDKISMVKSRIGQGKFRLNTIKEWGLGERCALTGVDIKEMLIASHIKPWAECENDSERLDGANGIMLCAHIDKLFDRHLITVRKVRSDFVIEVAPTLDTAVLKMLGIEPRTELSTHKMSLKTEAKFAQYLLWHNKMFDEINS